MSVSGDTYCKSAWNGFLLNLKHLVKFYFAQKIGAFLVFIGIMIIACINTGIFYALLQI